MLKLGVNLNSLKRGNFSNKSSSNIASNTGGNLEEQCLGCEKTGESGKTIPLIAVTKQM